MKNVELRLSLIKSGALLALFIFFIYAFAVNDSGGIGGTIGSLISVITYILGLSIALIICVLIMFCIYFGILYLYNPDVSKKTYGEFKDLSTKATSKLPISTKCCTSQQSVVSAEEPVGVELADIERDQSALAKDLSTLSSSIEGIHSTLTAVQNSIGAIEEELSTIKEQTASLDTAIQDKADISAISDATSSMSSELQTIKGATQPLETKLANLEQQITELNETDTPPVQELIDTAVTALQGKIDSMSKDIETLSATAATTDETEEEEHRILSYFTNKGDQKKFISSVQEAVDQGMTYAQIDEFLADNLPDDLAAIAADHPSLTKDYIRTIRQK